MAVRCQLGKEPKLADASGRSCGVFGKDHALRKQVHSVVHGQWMKRLTVLCVAVNCATIVMTADGQSLGPISQVVEDSVVVARGGDEANKVSLPREYFTATEAGPQARLTLAQIEEAAAGASE